MKHIVRKAYWDFEKEEKWLNEMSAKGLSMTDYSWCRYVFEETPGERYEYKIELLENLPTHPESSSYLRFLEENEIEFVASYMRWVYLRKKASDGPFDLYTDNESRIKHYKTVALFWSLLMAVEFGTGGVNLIIALINILVLHERLGNYPYSNLILGIVLTGFGVLFLKISAPIRKKIRMLEQERAIRE